MPIYFRNGKLATEKTSIDENDGYWNLSVDSLIETIKDYEVVLFDVFDTLVMCKVIAISDVYKHVEKILDKHLGIHSNCAQYRKKAASEANCPIFDEIYDTFAKITGWDQQKVQIARECEWNVEQSILVPRTQMVNIYNSIRNEKEIHLAIYKD